MIYALLLMYAGAPFPQISWHASAEACLYEVVVAKQRQPIADAACVAVRLQDLALIHRQQVEPIPHD